MLTIGLDRPRNRLVLGIVAALLLLMVEASFGGPGATPVSVILAWDPSPDAQVAGYRLYYGVASQTYTNVIATQATSALVAGLTPGITYYFAVTAANSVGLESEFSNEISYLVPAPPAPPPPAPLPIPASCAAVATVQPPRLRVRLAAPGQIIIEGTGQRGLQYNLLASTDLAHWRTHAVFTAGPDGAFQFAVAPLTNRACAYRLQAAPIELPALRMSDRP